MGLTKPRPRKPVSQATISKLSKAMGDPTKTFYGQSLGGRVPPSASDPDRFLPENVLMPAGSKTFDGRDAEGLWSDTIMKNEARFPQYVAESKTGTVIYGNTREGMQIVQALKDLQQSNGNNPKAQKVIDDHYYDLVIAPQIKAQEEQLAKQREAKELEYATLKMRVIELEKRPAPVPVYENNTDLKWSLQKTSTYLPFAVVGIVLMVILLFLRRRA